MIGRPVLQALGLDVRTILAAAVDRFHGFFDVSTLYGPNDRATVTVARLFQGIYHSNGGIDEQDLTDDDGWLDMGPENPQEKKSIIDSKIKTSINNGISHDGAKNLNPY